VLPLMTHCGVISFSSPSGRRESPPSHSSPFLFLLFHHHMSRRLTLQSGRHLSFLQCSLRFSFSPRSEALNLLHIGKTVRSPLCRVIENILLLSRLSQLNLCPKMESGLPFPRGVGGFFLFSSSNPRFSLSSFSLSSPKRWLFVTRIFIILLCPLFPLPRAAGLLHTLQSLVDVRLRFVFFFPRCDIDRFFPFHFCGPPHSFLSPISMPMSWFE